MDKKVCTLEYLDIPNSLRSLGAGKTSVSGLERLRWERSISTNSSHKPNISTERLDISQNDPDNSSSHPRKKGKSGEVVNV